MVNGVKLNMSLIFYSLIFLLSFQVLAAPLGSFALNKTSGVSVYSAFLGAEVNAKMPVFQKGLSYTTWSVDAFNSSESDESLRLLTETNTDWIAICLSWTQSNTTAHDIRPDPNRTPTTDSVRHAIALAHSLGLKVMLKPMVDCRDGNW